MLLPEASPGRPNSLGLILSGFYAVLRVVILSTTVPRGSCMPSTHGGLSTASLVLDILVQHDGFAHVERIGINAPSTGLKALLVVPHENRLYRSVRCLLLRGALHP